MSDRVNDAWIQMHVDSPTDFGRAVRELRDLRAAQRADAERVKAVVSQAVADVLALNAASTATIAEIHIAGIVLGKATADIVAEQLASAAPVLSKEERDALIWLRGHCRTNWATNEARLAGIALDRLLGATP